MMNTESIAQILLDHVAQNNLQADIIIDQGQSLSLKSSQGELSEQKVSASRKIGLRLFDNDRVGIAYTEAADEEALHRLVRQAMDNAQFARSEPQALTEPLSKIPESNIDLCPSDTVTTTQKIQAVLELEAVALAKPDIRRVPYNGISDQLARRDIYNSAGLHLSRQSRGVSAFVAPLATRDDDNAMFAGLSVARTFNDLDLNAIVESSTEEARALLDSQKINSGKYDVIFSPDEQSQLFDVFSMVFSAKAAKDGTNPWRDKVGQTVAVKSLQLSDNPHLNGMGYALFDDEGTVTQPQPLIVAGELTTMLHNQATAQYFNTRSTGHAARSPMGNAGISVHQWHLQGEQGGDKTLQEGEYLEITDLQGLHSGANPIAGTFSFGASGYLCKNGERLHSVRGITVAGNFYDLLQQIETVGENEKWNSSHSSLMAPVRFGSLSVSA
ncbi:TldD/PmbA family protein [Bermanella sp. R86510]|uniref:TldD/PmbA family protein n=1 Tax=unclassified Bermanella TaxID=2627862 RepID=UPI0037C5066F